MKSDDDWDNYGVKCDIGNRDAEAHEKQLVPESLMTKKPEMRLFLTVN